MPASNPKLDDLSLTSKLDSAQLHKLAIKLDLVAIALAALTRIEQVEMRQVAADLQVESIVSGWIDKWSPDRFISSGQLDLQQLRALVSIVHRLAIAHQALVRRNITYWQQTVQADLLPLQSPLLADYLNNFITIYQAHFGSEVSFEALSEAALTLLLELLFYGGATGHQRLWVALLQRAQSAVIPPSSI